MTKKQSLIYFFSGLTLTGITLTIALSQNLNHFCETSEIVNEKRPLADCQRIGGLVKAGSVINRSTGKISFALTDTLTTITVQYDGLLPDLFREGQGIIAVGKLTSKTTFLATQVLAKHDENYTPLKPKAKP